MVLQHLQPSFTGGEVSPSLQSRTDAAAYRTWLHTAKNMIVHPQGGISNRPGTQYMGTAKYAEMPCRLTPFVISTTEAYVVEAGEYYMRFYTANGPVLTDGGTWLELPTPYPAQALPALCVAQYNQTLYLAHGNYPLMRLRYTGPGRFTLEEAPLTGGPFQPQNTQTAHKMRLVPHTQTVVSQGVAATLSFEPLNTYPDHMIWAYFNGQLFYASEEFGLNTAAIVQAFNTAYGAQGLAAANLGGIIQVSSPVQTGGDWNGKTFVLEYRRSFSSVTDTLTQTLSGGENAGTQTVAQAGQYLLQSTADYFTPSHVGALFCVTHLVDGQLQSGTLGYESVSGGIKSSSGWNLRTSGNWTGVLEVEASRDLGQTWQTVKTLSRAEGEDNFYLTGDLNDPENLFEVRVRARQISGEAGYELSTDPFVQRGIVSVLSYVSPTEVVVTCEQAFGSDEWTDAWAEGAFSQAAGYPSCVFCFQDRLGLAATRAQAQTLWFSKTGNLLDFNHARDTFLDTDSLCVCLAGGQLNAVQAVCVSNRLLIFTAGGEWSLSCSGPFTLDHLQLEAQGTRGAYPTAPVMVGERVLFVQARGSVLRQLQYDYTACAYTSADVTLRARHLFEDRTIVQLAYAQEPDSVLWGVLSDGTCLSLTYVPEQAVYAWTHHQTQGEVVSICTVPQEGRDRVWLCVKRNGRYLLERLAVRTTRTEPAEQLFLDASVSYMFNTPKTQVTGLAHLNGMEVNVLADGNVMTGLTVREGQITLPVAARRVHVGLAYESVLQTLPIAVGGQARRLVQVAVTLLNSRGGQVGVSDGVMTEFVQRSQEGYGIPVALQSGRSCMLLEAKSDFSSGVVVRQTDPLPLTVLALEVQAV